MNLRRVSMVSQGRSDVWNVRVTGRTGHSSDEAAGAPRYSVDMIADGFAVLAKANGKPTDDTGG